MLEASALCCIAPPADSVSAQHRHAMASGNARVRRRVRTPANG
ncbi:hypothetical protein PXO_00682 [Xanthomonas oryzae pv. oryzae PXO99A]|uniref:Uncharacterized protein n=1 Tax=Xanthomonas oryzae pv. oryzae (strain PXO99A) TaxID=360094 RepID=A0A0K0GKD7_XANOP|nr:hypothetical protein PXO_00682 [Xanthomonas oryzae pv. oryzae PXO99A]